MDKQIVETILKKVQNPVSHKDIWSEGSVDSVAVEGDKATVTIRTREDRRFQLALEAQVRTQSLTASIPADAIKLKFITEEAAPKSSGPITPGKSLANVKSILLVGSGKGGVGKSTVSLNLALSLKMAGKSVGIMDADIYGPSIGKMTGLNGRQNMRVVDDKIIPAERHGLRIMSFAFLVDEGQPVVWRGPMLGKALEQFLYDVEWGDLDYLIIDLPPGTGDAQLSLAQLAQTDAAIIVTTPQNVALLDAERAAGMFRQVNIPIAGVVENMSEFVCPKCGHHAHIFGKGGGSRLAEKSDVPLLARIPLTVELMEAGEKGEPVVGKSDKGPVAEAFAGLADAVLKRVPL